MSAGRLLRFTFKLVRIAQRVVQDPGQIYNFYPNRELTILITEMISIMRDETSTAIFANDVIGLVIN